MKKNTIKFIICFISAVAVFIGSIYYSKKAVSPGEIIDVCRATANIEEGTVIDNNNINDLFEVKSISEKEVVESYVVDKNELLNKRVTSEILQNETISMKRFQSIDDILSKIEKPVDVSIKFSDPGQVVGGVIRQGDFVKISLIDSVSGVAKELLNNVYVKKALASDMTELTRNSKGAALTLIFTMDQKDETKLNSNIENGTVRISKVLE